MKSLLFMSITMAFVLGCSPSNTPEAAGTHNLSKGDCIDIPCANGQCRRELVTEEMTQTHCEIVGGQYVPKDHRKSFWF